DFETKTVDLQKGDYAFKFAKASGDKSLDYSFTLKDYVWGPANYSPLASKILESFDLKASPTSEAPKDFIKNIATAEIPALFVENERISKALTENPLDAGLHEQAALLQATYGMLELAGILSDTRSSLARTSAHLSIAKALNSDKLSIVGQTANIALEAMSCRDGIALKLIEAIDQSKLDSSEKSFLRAIKIRASGDFRLFDQNDHTTLEANQYALRYAPSMGNEKVLQFIRKNYPDGKIIWFRTLMSGGLNVQMGHMIATKALKMEMHEFVKNYQAYKKKEIVDSVAVAKDLNLQPTRCLANDSDGPHLNVISWDDVAATHARDILWAIYTEWTFYKYMYAVKELADTSITNAETLFGELALFPVPLIFADLSPEKKQQYYARAQNTIENHPEMMTDFDWLTIIRAAKKIPAKSPITPPNAWFDPALPMGTAYGFSGRKEFPNASFTVEELSRLHQLCPNDEKLSKEYAKKKYGDHPTQEQLEEAFGAQLNTNIRLMKAAARTNIHDPQKFIPLFVKICALEPDEYFDLARYCVLQNRTEEAAKYFEKAMEVGTDAVGKSNDSDWLMRYYYSKGQKAKAKQIADFAAQVYSNRGLLTLANYYELENDLESAEKEHKKIQERYDSSSFLGAFYLRNAKKNKRYEVEGEKIKAEIFPAGLKKVVISDFKDPPRKGVRVVYADEMSVVQDLAKDTVAVALSGYAIENLNQLLFLEHIGTEPYLNFIIWDGKKYMETKKMTVQNRTAGARFDDFKEKLQ
ncbi:MAG: hypothetical protein IAF58_00600, partial [Leptolyngbya sp.]|nr:hypothetical protein [Candidatus Melainabacteria bacterium]